MFSITNQDDNNDIFSIARKYERMNIEEMSNFEFKPTELMFLNINSVENSSVTSGFQLFITKFNELYGLIKQYEYKPDINSNFVSNTIRKQTADEQVDFVISKGRVRINSDIVNMQKRIKEKLTDVKLNTTLTSQELDNRTTNILTYLTDEIVVLDTLPDIDNYILRIVLENAVEFFIVKKISTSPKLDKIRSDFNEELSQQKEYNEILKTIILDQIKYDNKYSLEGLLLKESASTVVSELDTLKTATPIVRSMIDSIKTNFDKWNNLLDSGSIQQKPSLNNFKYKIQDDMDEIINIMDTKPKEPFKTYKITKDLITDLSKYVFKFGT